jgi:hypothetical protein
MLSEANIKIVARNDADMEANQESVEAVWPGVFCGSLTLGSRRRPIRSQESAMKMTTNSAAKPVSATPAGRERSRVAWLIAAALMAQPSTKKLIDTQTEVAR